MAHFRTSALALLVLASLALNPGCESDTVPILPPLTISAPDLAGEVRVDGDAEPQALVFGFNEERGEGAITTADAAGRYQLVLGADVGDAVTVWQRVGTRDSIPRSEIVPPL